MINPVSLKLRNLNPVRSYPARVDGWKIVFLGMGGMASLAREDGAHMHGVLHLLTDAEMKVLDEIESVYCRAEVPCTLYDQHTTVSGSAYVMVRITSLWVLLYAWKRVLE